MKKLFKSFTTLLFLKKVSLAKKMGLFVLTLALLAGGTIFFAQKMNKDLAIVLNSSTNSFKSSTNGVYIASVSRGIQMLKSRAELLDAQIAGGLDFSGDDLEMDIEELNDNIQGLVGESLGLGFDKKANDFEKFWISKKKIADLALEQVNSGDGEAAKATLGNLIEESDKIYESLLSLQESNSAVAQNSYRSTFTVKGKTIYNIYGIAAATLLLSLIGIVFFLSLAKRLDQITAVISGATQKLVKESDDLANVSNTLSGTIDTHQESLTESVSAVDEITAMNKRTMEISRETNSSALECKGVGEKGKDQFSEVLSSMNEINSFNKEIMEEVSRSGKEIGNVIDVINQIAEKTKVINDIVFQTKLLSFNASVEAARAGEHGKGFAVVAEEVGALASMSGKAADEISTLLSQSTKTVEETIDGSQSRMKNIIEQGSKIVEKGMNISNDCSSSMDQIVHQINGLSTKMNEVTQAGEEQARGVEDISEGLQLMHDSSTTTVSVSTSVSKSSESLKDYATDFSEIVFSLEEIIFGEKNKKNVSSSDTNNKDEPDNVIPLKVEEDQSQVTEIKGDLPTGDDPRFEEA